MTDEPTTVQVTAGPYAGQRLTMPAADAAAAIADKWAVDPHAPPPKEGEEAKPMSDEEISQVKAKAEKAARKLRGEPEPDTKPEPAHKLHSEPEAPTRDIVAERPATYTTKAPAKK